MAEVNGLVNSVQRVSRGSELVAAATIGATTLYVDSAEDFDDAGGDLDINGIRYVYTASDIDADTITLASPGLTAAAAVSDGVYLVMGGQIAVDHIAFVSLGEGDEAEVIIPFASRVYWPEGDMEPPVPVTLTTDLESIVAVPGRSPVFDILDTFRVDSSTGEVTMIGEVGTAPPGEIGVFLFSTKFSYAGTQVDRPTVEFNTGATVVQPRIEAVSALGAGMFLSSGRDSGERESKLTLSNNEVIAYVQNAPGGSIGSNLHIENDRISAQVNVGGTAGAYLSIGDDVDIRSLFDYGAFNLAGQFKSFFSGGEAYAFVGLQNLAGTNRQGLFIREDVSARIYAGTVMEVVNRAGSAYLPINASAFTVSSDRASKTAIAAPQVSALEVVRNAPTYEYAYKNDPEGVRRLGVMAGDLPEILTRQMVPDDPEHFAGGMKGVSLSEQVALLWQALTELDAELDNAPGLRLKKPTRAKRKLSS